MSSVAAIIPTFNRERCIGRAIDSVLAQSFPDVECIVVDDGSTDGTRALVATYGARVRYVLQHNAGQGPARNQGVECTAAQWVAFLDSDDIWLPNKVERQLAFLQQCGADVCFTDFSLRRDLARDGIESWIGEGQRRGCHPTLLVGLLTHPISVLAGGPDVVFTSTVMMRRDVFVEAGGYDGRFRRCQDVELHLRLGMTCSWCYLPEVLSRKELNENVARERTYLYRTAAMGSAFDIATRFDDHDSARVLRASLRREFRALAGYRWRHGHLVDALCASVGLVFPAALAPAAGTLQRRAERLRK